MLFSRKAAAMPSFGPKIFFAPLANLARGKHRIRHFAQSRKGRQGKPAGCHCLLLTANRLLGKEGTYGRIPIRALVLYEGAKEILDASDHYLSAYAGEPHCFDFGLRRGAVHLHAVLTVSSKPLALSSSYGPSLCFPAARCSRDKVSRQRTGFDAAKHLVRSLILKRCGGR